MSDDHIVISGHHGQWYSLGMDGSLHQDLGPSSCLGNVGSADALSAGEQGHHHCYRASTSIE